MPDTIGCYDRDCICNQKEPEPCEMCDHGRIYEDWRSECCLALPGGAIAKQTEAMGTGTCSACGREMEFIREYRECKCQG